MTLQGRQQLEELAAEPPVRYLRPQRRPEVRRRAVWRQLLRWGPRLVAGAAVLAVLGATFYAGFRFLDTSPRFRLWDTSAVEVLNLRYASATLVRERFAEDAGRSVLWIPLEARRKAVEEIPWIARARVERLLPNRLRVVVEERTPVAFLRQGSQLVLVDAEGVLLERPEAARFTFPVVTGIHPGMEREERRARLKLYEEFIRDLDAGERTYSDDISEVDLSDTENLRATVAEKGEAVLLHFGRDRYREKYEAYRKHRPLWQQTGERVDSVDLRYRGQLVLNPEAEAPLGGRTR